MKPFSEDVVCSLDVDIGSPVNGRRETSSVEDVARSVAVLLDVDVARSVAVLFLRSSFLGLSKFAALSNAFTSAMKDQGGLSLC